MNKYTCQVSDTTPNAIYSDREWFDVEAPTPAAAAALAAKEWPLFGKATRVRVYPLGASNDLAGCIYDTQS